MAEVYKVKTVGIAGFEKIQALKRILPHSAREGRFIRSFIDEARIAVELTHRNIVQVFDFGKADGELFLAMELIEGNDLRTATSQAVARDLPAPIPVARVHHRGGRERARLRAPQDRRLRRRAQHRALRRVAVERDAVARRLRQDPRLRDRARDVRERARAAAACAASRATWRPSRRSASRRPPPPTCSRSASSRGSCSPGLPLYRGPDLKSILEAVRRTDAAAPRSVEPGGAEGDRRRDREGAVARAAGSRDRGGSCCRRARAASMQGGARALAKWLTEIEEGTGSLPGVSIPSLSVQRASTSVPARPPVREPTQSLVDSRCRCRPAESISARARRGSGRRAR